MDQIKVGKFISTNRKLKHMTQRELADILSISDKTISKWETGLSVPDSEMLISLSKVLDIPVNVLLEQNLHTENELEIKDLSLRLEAINVYLAQKEKSRKKRYQKLLILLCVLVVLIFGFLVYFNSPYLEWNYANPERAVLGVGYHVFEWLFVRIAPVILICAIVEIIVLKKALKS
ncbi:helix-turn-helix domain-containing protein [Faecalitalea cylindroides]|uniref:helix-turn-helix domain-containing protein n=1 Tax=Faecalitalea cylindroides TaxID=39483 RepID=UPI003994AC87